MSKPSLPSTRLSREEIGALYDEGKEAVISLVEGLLTRLASLGSDTEVVMSRDRCCA